MKSIKNTKEYSQIKTGSEKESPRIDYNKLLRISDESKKRLAKYLP